MQALDFEIYRGQEVIPDLITKLRLQIAVNNDLVETPIDAILSSARTGAKGDIGDGKIFVTELVECVRIRTGERGSEAI